MYFGYDIKKSESFETPSNQCPSLLTAHEQLFPYCLILILDKLSKAIRRSKVKRTYNIWSQLQFTAHDPQACLVQDCAFTCVGPGATMCPGALIFAEAHD